LTNALAHGAAVAAVAAVLVGWGTRFEAPPRFDGAGYAVLGQAILTGQGYREIDRPDRPPHDHYPPGYPFALAALWRLTGRSAAAARGLSIACTVAATVAAWLWFRGLFAPRAALVLGLALACNWTWGRAGGEIQSEPLFLLLGQTALLVEAWAVQTGGIGRGIVLGLVLAACVLTRHVGICLALAVGVELLLQRRTATALVAGLTAMVLVAPWVAWLASVRHNTQVGLLARGDLGARVAGNALFYLLRLPDQLTGPFVEVGTVFGRSRMVAAMAAAWGVLGTGVIVWGWARALRTPRRRLAATVPLFTLALLLVWPFTEAGRFLIPLVPFLLVGAVEGLASLASVIGLRRPCAWAVGAVLLAAIPYTAYSLASDRAGARQRGHEGFDAACAWIARRGDVEGPILTRQPGEAYWLTGRTALLPPGDDPGAIDEAMERYGVAYLLVDDERYARAPTNPLKGYVASHPDRVARVWGPDGGPIAVYAVRRERPVSGPAGPRT
jgi:hypothetical protein